MSPIVCCCTPVGGAVIFTQPPSDSASARSAAAGKDRLTQPTVSAGAAQRHPAPGKFAPPMKMTPAPLLVLLALLVAASPAAAAKAKPQTRYSLVHGCYALKSGGKTLPGAGHVRMQATALGSYLLYLPDKTFLAAQDGKVAPATDPSPAADWVVKGKGAFTLTPKSGTGPVLKKVRVTRTKGCATYPEAAL